MTFPLRSLTMSGYTAGNLLENGVKRSGSFLLREVRGPLENGITGSQVAERLGIWARNQKVTGLISGCANDVVSLG